VQVIVATGGFGADFANDSLLSQVTCLRMFVVACDSGSSTSLLLVTPV
jgi:hypothetical protein